MQPAMVKIDAPDSMTIKRSTIEEKMGRAFDLQELQLHLITLTGHIDETDDEFNLSWSH
jgi:phenol hydroxylase P2 protein